MARLNYTGRKSIARKDAEISLQPFESGDGKKHIKINVDLALSDYRFNPNSPVYVDIYSNDYLTSVRLGTAGNPRPTGPSTIPTPPEVLDLKVRVKVLSNEPESARIVGILRGFAPRISDQEGQAGKKSLIAVRSMDLEGEIWRIEMEESDEAPVLNIDKSLGDHLALFNTPWFAAAIMGQVFKEILFRILIVERYEPDEDTNWSRWLIFARQYAPDRQRPPSISESDDGADSQLALNWIEDVVKRFSREQKYLDSFRQHLEVKST